MMASEPGHEGEENASAAAEGGIFQLLQTDIKDLEIARRLRKLGNKKVTEWDFRDMIPAVQELARKEVDVVGLVKRIADYKVMEWDFRELLGGDEAGDVATPEVDEMAVLVAKIAAFLRYVTSEIADERVGFEVEQIEPTTLRFRIIASEKDYKTLIGRQGVTAAALRGVVKSVAAENGAHALLQILPRKKRKPN